VSAARALAAHSTLTARRIAEIAMEIAADICIYTNGRVSIEEIADALPPSASRV
jgi:ATP-dependent HslUV protease subunit HslV